MASGKIWSGTLPNASNQDTGAAAAGKIRTASINVVNNGATDAHLKVYISTSASPTNADLIEADNMLIPAHGIYKVTGEIVGPGERIVLRADTANCIARVTAFEEDL
ncbi:MAG: hypothetical protein K2Q13_09985 [Nitrosomonas sp.]|uniref:hypothetical protein n=1 Tax=Nitrosomonas sp. TaxID=42353 RepID=UPI0025FB5128|nr:hypothetical protein [Nitrosomonas sp.]MBY0475370.1 hypothetical protein [Nitrosomonas sp.]